MLDKNLKFLEDCFKKYYFEKFNLIHVPSRTIEREFGYQKFNSGMTRHLTVKNDRQLHLILMNNIPSDVYCSNACYSFPNLPMNEKDWKEADLIFDIDAKDLNLDCRKTHTITKCIECNNISLSSDSCNNCNSTKLEFKSLPCKNCVEESKNEVKKLIKILTDDFAIDPKNIQVYFSGNEGFHLYVYDSQFQKMGSRERAELADYILFKGAIPERFGMKKFKPDRSSFPDLDENGWRGRVAKELFGSKSKRSKIISQILAEGYSSFQNKLEDLSQRIGVKIDPNVTMDVHRIFRLPGSLNSKSGMTKIPCDDLSKFDPYRDAIFLKDDSVKVVVSTPIEFKLKGKRFGPYDNEEVEIPSYAAAYMICKGFANIS